MTEKTQTFQKENTNNSLECFEWENLWHEHTTDCSLPRVLIIGDSISCGYRTELNRLSKGQFYTDNFASSKGIDNPFFLKSLALFTAQMPRCDSILLNNGLHGWHLTSEEYKAHYAALIAGLKKLSPSSGLSLLLTTPLCEENHKRALQQRNNLVCARNAAVLEIAAEHHIKTLDLYQPFYKQYRYFSKDGVHLTKRGYKKAACICMRHIKEEISKSGSASS